MKSTAAAMPKNVETTYVFPPDVESKLQAYEALSSSLNGGGLRLFNKIQTMVSILLTMEHIIANPNENPWATLSAALDKQITVLEETKKIEKDMLPNEAAGRMFGDAERVEKLFEAAWTTYNDDVYDHSIQLVVDRLKATGYDEAWFKGKRCFDGGCGTGRLAIAMAKMGAKESWAVDIGQESLDFCKVQAARHGVADKVVIKRSDVTNLKDFESNSFDFVASNGVLHHTLDCIGGTKEHYRITAEGGCYWLYLYGAGGFYWDLYDRLKNLLRAYDAADIKQVLKTMQIRHGIIYTFLDNNFALRTYYYESEILDLLRPMAALESKYQSGPKIYDDMGKYLATKYGKDILGPEGEVRIAITKKAKSA